MGYNQTTLNNGVRLITNTMLHTQSASSILYFGVGSRYEPDNIAGISHFIEHMVFKGTKKRPTAREISEAIEGVGGVLNASTDREVTNYWAKVPKTHFAMSFDVLTDMLTNANFDPTEVEKERKVIIEELAQTLDSPPDLANEIINQVLWGEDQPAGRDIGGDATTVGNITRDDLTGFLKSYYVPSEIVVSVAGNIDHDEVLRLTEASLGQLPARERPGAGVTTTLSGGPLLKVYDKDTEQANLCLAVPAVSYRDPRRYVLSMLDNIMGAGMSSRLFQEVREERGLAYTVDSYSSQLSDSGAWVVYSGVDTDNIDETISTILLELEKICQQPVADSELRKVKEYSKGRMLLSLEDSRAVASWAGNQELLLGRILAVEEVVEKIEAVSAAQIQDLAQEMFQTANLRLSVVGPYAEQDDRFRELLKLN